ncbi:DUF481 domain-containing protein [Dasania sp. GY-MA-18]|uniref:DUF481 domain-containing protein n=1 Tax=Dasania phycosphaerae TaxID=2950436 RepID=A0A9J6RNI9_9GAMM|nr:MULTISPECIES: DUF481 domain-containing protein [Dasania]MCR8923665.1 DUF481 domain-containing protein [Dasania sp. GY-MA-18]MCZ0866099.1 DUF481 domain-containing protein [Dasania phycosphaerae]MCZ0869823.1 DUF481 domain-containing protein [Dasania phycosphaerae]
MKKNHVVFISAALASAVTMQARAEEAAAEAVSCEAAVAAANAACEPALVTVEQPKAVKLWSGEIDASYINLSGNTEETTTSGAIHLTRKKDAWKYIIHAEGLSSVKDDVRTAEKYYAYNKLSYNFSEKSYYFGMLSYTDDNFGGYDYQSTAIAGLGRNLLNVENMVWDIEAGLGYRVSKIEADADAMVAEDDQDEAILRLATLYTWTISDSANFLQSLSSEVGEENSISQSETALKVKINSSLSLKLAYKIKYTDEVPVDTKRADKETLVSLSYSF